MKRAIEIFAALGAVFVLVGCSGGPETGPGQVRWDKVSCERCLMAVSDRHFSAQIRGGPAERKSRLYFFDDFGCAVLWLEEQPWRNESRNEIWVTDAANGPVARCPHGPLHHRIHHAHGFRAGRRGRRHVGHPHL